MTGSMRTMVILNLKAENKATPEVQLQLEDRKDEHLACGAHTRRHTGERSALRSRAHGRRRELLHECYVLRPDRGEVPQEDAVGRSRRLDPSYSPARSGRVQTPRTC